MSKASLPGPLSVIPVGKPMENPSAMVVVDTVGVGDEGKDESDVTRDAGLSHSRRGECSE